MIDTSDYVSLDPNLNEISDNLKNPRLEHDRNYGHNYCRKIEVRCNVKFLDKIDNKPRKITIEKIVYVKG